MKKFKNFIVLFFSIIVAMILCEFILRIFYPSLLISQNLCMPYFTAEFKPTPGVMPGVFRDAKFITNSYGIRADELSPKYTKRILAVGGSTTECLYLDQKRAWPYLLQTKLNEVLGKNSVWVGNAGLSGKSTGDHLKLLNTIPLKKMKVDTIVMLVGVNDFSRRLALDKSYAPSYSQENIFLLVSRNTAIWNLLRKIRHSYFPKESEKLNQDYAGNIYISWRENRRTSKKIVNNLPDLSSALDEYFNNINMLIDLAVKNNIDVVFLTQPTLWRKGLPADLQNLLWMGGVGNFQKEKYHTYYSAEALAIGMEKYNNILLKACKLRNVKCIDLASILLKDTSIFYDDCHLNEKGSRIVSEVLTKYILEKG